MSAATPGTALPWYSTKARVYDYAYSILAGKPNTTNLVIADVCERGAAKGENDELAKANAAYIVTAANAYPDLLALVKKMAEAEAAYRQAHDLYGDGDIRTGRAWDAMRRAGDEARATLTEATAIMGEGK